MNTQNGGGVPRCKVCNRPLRSAEAIKNGMGHECAKRYMTQSGMSPDFNAFAISKGISEFDLQSMKRAVDNIKNNKLKSGVVGEVGRVNKLRARQYHELVKEYEEHLKTQENNTQESEVQTFEEYVKEKGQSLESLEQEKNNLLEQIAQKEEVVREYSDYDNDTKYQDANIKFERANKYYRAKDVIEKLQRLYDNSEYFRLLQRYKGEVIDKLGKRFLPLGANTNHPTEVDYAYLSNDKMNILNTVYNGRNETLTTYTEVKPQQDTNHPPFYEVVSFRKEGEDTVVRIETIGLKGAEFSQELRNPKFDPNNPYASPICQLKEDFEMQTSISPERPPNSKFDSVFKHGYDCDYPLLREQFEKYGIDIKSVNYYEPSNQDPVMSIKLHDEKDGEVEISYSMSHDGITTTIQRGDNINHFKEGSKEWLYHPTHLKYHALFKETHRDYKEQNKERLKSVLTEELGKLHQGRNQIMADGYMRLNNHTKQIADRYSTQIERLTLQLDALNDKSDPNVTSLKKVIKQEEDIKLKLFQTEWNESTQDANRENFDFRLLPKAKHEIKGYFTKLKLQRIGILP